MAVFLAHALSQRAADLAEFPLAVGLGLLCHLDLSNGKHFFSSAAGYSGLRAHTRPDHRSAEKDLRRARSGMAGNNEAVAQAGVGHADHGHRDRARRDIGTHDRIVRLRDGACTDVAFDDFRTVFRRRRDLSLQDRLLPVRAARALHAY